MLVVSLSLAPAMRTHAAFLKLGPFLFDASTRFEAVATSNVEQERPSEAEADRRDFYLVWGLDLTSTAEFMPRTRVMIDTGIAIEEHFNRPDLNNSENPFGRFNGTAESDWDPIRLNGGIRWERTSESVDKKFIPRESGVSRKGRQIGTEAEALWGIQWESEYILLGYDYSFLQERFDADEFKPEEQDEETKTAYVELRIAESISVRAEEELTITDRINEAGPVTRERTETITINFDEGLLLLERPKIEYSIGVQREYEDSETEGWELIHTLTVSDNWEISPTLRLSGTASYNYEDSPEEDDIAFTYDITLEQDLSRRTTHALSFSREPRDTFGANEDTDTTTIGYNISIADFLIPNVTASGSIQRELNQPVSGEEEVIWTYTVGLSHSVPINARLTRQIAYTYDLEDSDQEDELLEEHRITLSFVLSL